MTIGWHRVYVRESWIIESVGPYKWVTDRSDRVNPTNQNDRIKMADSDEYQRGETVVESTRLVIVITDMTPHACQEGEDQHETGH